MNGEVLEHSIQPLEPRFPCSAATTLNTVEHINNDHSIEIKQPRERNHPPHDTPRARRKSHAMDGKDSESSTWHHDQPMGVTVVLSQSTQPEESSIEGPPPTIIITQVPCKSQVALAKAHARQSQPRAAKSFAKNRAMRQESIGARNGPLDRPPSHAVQMSNFSRASTAATPTTAAAS
jgi:hypothetical protein